MTPEERLRRKIREVPDFPQKGVCFKDITPLLMDPETLALACELLAGSHREDGVDVVVGVESRGFIFGPSVALRLCAGFSLARKAGKLPWETMTEEYQLEYGSETIEMHRDAVHPGQRVLLVDDVIATGGTAAATVRLIRRMGAEVVGAMFLIELSALEGRKQLAGIDVGVVLQY